MVFTIIVVVNDCGRLIGWRETRRVVARRRAISAARELPDALARDAGFLLARAGGRAIRDLNRTLAPLDLRSRHYTVLAAVADDDGRSQRELGEMLAIDPSAVVAIVDDLEHAGLVRRAPDPADRRTRRVAATDAGRARAKEAHAGAQAVARELLAPLDDAERATLLALLTRVDGG